MKVIGYKNRISQSGKIYTDVYCTYPIEKGEGEGFGYFEQNTKFNLRGELKFEIGQSVRPVYGRTKDNTAYVRSLESCVE